VLLGIDDGTHGVARPHELDELLCVHSECEWRVTSEEAGVVLLSELGSSDYLATQHELT
jgi:hypothetical protein